MVLRAFLLGREFPYKSDLSLHTALFVFCNMFGNCVKLTLEVSINLSSKENRESFAHMPKLLFSYIILSAFFGNNNREGKKDSDHFKPDNMQQIHDTTKETLSGNEIYAHI